MGFEEALSALQAAHEEEISNLNQQHANEIAGLQRARDEGIKAIEEALQGFPGEDYAAKLVWLKKNSPALGALFSLHHSFGLNFIPEDLVEATLPDDQEGNFRNIMQAFFTELAIKLHQPISEGDRTALSQMALEFVLKVFGGKDNDKLLETLHKSGILRGTSYGDSDV